MRLRLAATGIVGALYIAFSHWLMTIAAPSPWNAVGVLTPMIAAAGIGCWEAGQRYRAFAALLLVATLVVQAAAGVQVPAPLLYLGQHVVVHGLLALWFASTLRDGARPLISVLAEKVHGRLTPAIDAYTRNVTRAWVAYFAGMAVLSVALFALAPFEVWAVFANLLTPLAVAAMFVGERVLRFRLHPDVPRTSLLDAVRAYLHADVSAVAASAPRDPMR